MEAGQSAGGLTWLSYALMTVVAWGIYGVFLHTGQSGMGDPVNARAKVFGVVAEQQMLRRLVFVNVGKPADRAMKAIVVEVVVGDGDLTKHNRLPLRP